MNRDKFLELVSYEDTNSIKKAKERIKNRYFTKVSSNIAISVLERMDELELSKKELAELLDISSYKLNKLLKGKSDLDLSTLCKIEDKLKIKILNI